ncbi:MAG: replication protein RepA [Candidatus Aenigmarchaeota archaeon]|nr:replication protein RepA [Candidatus Aenigmarchaeota archaeon]
MAEQDGFVTQRRLPAVEKTISEIDNSSVRVRITGTIIDKKNNTIMIDDGSGKIQVSFTESVPFEPQSLVRVFGRVIPAGEEMEIQGEIIQGMDGVDLETYRKVVELEKKTAV